MKKRGQAVIEIFLALILIVLLGILIILVLNPTFTGKSTSKNIQVEVSSTQSNLQRYCEYVKVPYQTEEIYYSSDNLRFDSWKKHETYDGVLGNEDRYTVYVKNLDDEDGYFKVIFYFYDNNGDENNIIVKKRIESRETEKFVYLDKYRYDDSKYWTYEVVSETKDSDNSRSTRIVTRYTTEKKCYWA